MIYSVEINEAEEKALLIDMESIQAWINNAIHNKARQCMDIIITEYSDKQPSKICLAERESIVIAAKVITAEAKNIASTEDLEK